MIITGEAVYYTVIIGNYERHFLTAWELIAFLSGTDLIIQQN